MADDRGNPSSHFSSLESKIIERTASPAEPQEGEFYYDTSLNRMYIYVTGAWRYGGFSTTTSTSTSTSTTTTSTSTTTTSTSTTSTSSSTTTSTSTSTSTTTSTTTTL